RHLRFQLLPPLRLTFSSACRRRTELIPIVRRNCAQRKRVAQGRRHAGQTANRFRGGDPELPEFRSHDPTPVCRDGWELFAAVADGPRDIQESATLRPLARRAWLQG